MINDGYPSLADWISRDPDHETFIFRRFDRLVARNLLNLQSDLVAREQRLDRMDEESRQRKDVGLRLWETFLDELEGGGNQAYATKRRDLFDKLEQKMKEYRKLSPVRVLLSSDIRSLLQTEEALLRQSQIAQLSRPRHRPYSIFYDWFHGKELNHVRKHPVIRGQAEKILNSKQDLLALKSASDTDTISRFLQDNWPSRGKQFHPKHSTAHFKEKNVSWVVGIISTIAAAALLIGSIAVLNIVGNQNRRIGWIAGFTLLFALSVVLLTNAKRVEVFAATAAYVAVLVVFVSNNQVGSGPGSS